MSDQADSQVMQGGRGPSIVWIVAVLLVVVAWAGAMALRGGGEKQVLVGWADGMPAGQQIAQETDRPMIVLFTATWCGYCQTLKKDVLNQPAVQDALRAGFVPVQIDMTDRSSANPNAPVAQQYNISGYPTVLAMSPEGQWIEEFRGERTLDRFIAWLDRMGQSRDQ